MTKIEINDIFVEILYRSILNCQNIPEFLSQGKPWTNEFIKFNIKVTIIFHSKITLNQKKGSNSRVYESKYVPTPLESKARRRKQGHVDN